MQIIKLVIAAIASTSAVCALPASGTTKAKIEDKRATQEDYDGVREFPIQALISHELGYNIFLLLTNYSEINRNATAQVATCSSKTSRALREPA